MWRPALGGSRSSDSCSQPNPLSLSCLGCPPDGIKAQILQCNIQGKFWRQWNYIQASCTSCTKLNQMMWCRSRWLNVLALQNNHKYRSILPFIIFHLFRFWSKGQQAKQRNPDNPLPCYFSQLWEGSRAFPGKPRDRISGVSLVWFLLLVALLLIHLPMDTS